MTPPAQSGPPIVFDEGLVAAREARAARREPGFLLERMVADVADRLGDVNRRFERMLLVAPEGAEGLLRERVAPDRLPGAIVARPPSAHTRLGLGGETFDLAVSLVGLGQLNDLPGALIEMRRSLRPDGLLVAGWFGGASLSQLRAALYADDEARRGGLSPRVHPGVGHTQAGQLLARAGLALPVVDTDRFTVSYRDPRTLLADLRDAGVTNALVARDRGYLGRGAVERIAALLETAMDAGPRYPVTFEVVWATGWAPDASQPKPLRPGSAKMRLADALGVREGKL